MPALSPGNPRGMYGRDGVQFLCLGFELALFFALAASHLCDVFLFVF